MGQYFSTKKVDGKWFLVDPKGILFYSLGVDCMVCQIRETKGDIVELYGGERGWFENWAETKLKQVLGMGFNTIGAWHEPYYWSNNIPKGIELRLTKHAKKVNSVWGVGFPDVFDKSFGASIHQQLVDVFYGKEEMLIHNSPLIGYYTDNELHWWGSAGQWGKDDQEQGSDSTGLIDDYINLSADSAGKKAWVDFIKAKYSTIQQLNGSWESEYCDFSELLHNHQYRAKPDVIKQDKIEFLELVARVYFETTSTILKQYDSNHMNLGCRLVGTSAPDIVLKVMSEYVDVVSINFYSMQFPKDYLDHLYDIVKKPIMITEFSFCCAKESGFLASTNGAQNVIVKNQSRRGEEYQKFVMDAYRQPYMVGTHWFALYDYVGDEHGLIGNYGLFNHQDCEWKEMTSWVRETNNNIIQDVNSKMNK